MYLDDIARSFIAGSLDVFDDYVAGRGRHNCLGRSCEEQQSCSFEIMFTEDTKITEGNIKDVSNSKDILLMHYQSRVILIVPLRKGAYLSVPPILCKAEAKLLYGLSVLQSKKGIENIQGGSMQSQYSILFVIGIGYFSVDASQIVPYCAALVLPYADDI